MQEVKKGISTPTKRVFGKKKEAGLSGEQKRLLNEYFATLSRLRSLQDFFERTTDSELISVCVYEMNAAQRHYAYLLARLKEEQVSYLKILR